MVTMQQPRLDGQIADYSGQQELLPESRHHNDSSPELMLVGMLPAELEGSADINEDIK